MLDEHCKFSPDLLIAVLSLNLTFAGASARVHAGFCRSLRRQTGLLCRIPVETFWSSLFLSLLRGVFPLSDYFISCYRGDPLALRLRQRWPSYPVKDFIHTMDVLLPHRLTSLISSIPSDNLELQPFFLAYFNPADAPLRLSFSC